MYAFLKLIAEINSTYSKQLLLENYKKILILIPLIPHFAYDMLKNLNTAVKIWMARLWWEIFKEEFVNIVVQINGKKRGLIKSEKGIKDEEVLKKLYQRKNISKYL